MKCDADTFAAKYKEIYLDLYRFALYTLKHKQDAEDVVSETVLDAWQSVHRLKKEDAFRPWIFCILTRKCQKHMKLSKHTTLELPEDLTEHTPDLSEAMDVRAAFYRLDDEERLILSLKLFAGYSGKEIAAMLNRNENTIRSRQSLHLPAGKTRPAKQRLTQLPFPVKHPMKTSIKASKRSQGDPLPFLKPISRNWAWMKQTLLKQTVPFSIF